MTILDMDISLNVTADPDFSARTNKQRRSESLKTSIKRLKNQSLGNKGIAANNKSKNMNTQKIESKKRIKQISLSTIFANKLKEANAVTQNAQSQIVPCVKDIMAKAPESGKIKQSDKSNKVLSIANCDITNEQTVSFTKITKQHIGETLLAKKRNILIEQKRSLSNIFSGRFKNESNKIELNVSHDIDKDSKLNKKSEIVTEKSPTLKVMERIDILNKRDDKEHKEKIVNNNRKSDKSPKLMHKAGGKISSLFGNNPDVPTIGQRLVKPVDEPVFTKIIFADLNIHPYMISNLEQNMHITKMTTVQQKAIPEIFSARDVLIRSQTGSGKTLAYALPIVELLHKIKPKLNRNSGLLALVVVPTRELALQTYECFIKLVKPFTWIVPGYIIGGEKRKAEKARLRKGCNILITTPGRLLDHIRHTKALRLNEVRYFVLDEADRMLDMGYEKDISEIVSVLKVSSSNKVESGYDAMKILKQNIKDTSTDKNISKEDDIKSYNKVEDHIDSDKVRRVYHSSDDSEDDNQDIDEKKVSLKERKKDTKYLSINQRSDSKSENAQKIERDCKDVNQSRRQTILLSATLTQAVEKLAGLAMHNPIFVDAAKENLERSGGDTSEINEDLIVPQGVIQSYIVTPPKLRMVTLSAYIASRCQTPGQHKIVIFMATQDMVDYHTEILSFVLTKPVDDDDEDSDPLVDVEFFKLHGNMTQKERTEVFKTFSQAKSGVLLCTLITSVLHRPN
ncbi:ATP-dependent DNA helicase DDX31 isoform X2 [Polyergus mexicanus]|uniref:ATP-dependent DNA helicase DDX31 isoform X2 n=1 Tax=Polyergus mexicanus TaxID=615972 RepID=UPI0038B44CF7